MSSHKFPASGGGSSAYYGDPVANVASLPASGTVGELRVVLDVDDIYEWNGSAWERITQNSADVAGPSASVDSELVLFDSTTGKLLKRATGTGYVKGTSGVASFQAAPIPVADGGTNSTTALNNNRVIQSSGGAIVEAAAITASRALISDANGIPTHSGVTSTVLGYLDATSSVQTQLDAMVEKTGDTMSGTLNADGGIDVTATGGSDVLNIGNTNADVINIGRSGATVNMYGTLNNQNVTNLEVTDKLITINNGGAAASGNDSGIEVEEDSTITGYAKVGNSRNSWVLKAPNTAGDATITPGSGGITLNQSSHDPVTIGTANGLSLSTQALSLQAATSGQNGALTSTDWTTFNSKLAIEGVVAVASDVTLTNRRVHFVDTSAARSLTLPAPSASLYIVIKDSIGSCQTNNITLVRPGSEKIETVAASFTLNENLASWTIVSDGVDFFLI